MTAAARNKLVGHKGKWSPECRVMRDKDVRSTAGAPWSPFVGTGIVLGYQDTQLPVDATELTL